MIALLCSSCFHDQGLRLDSARLGADDPAPCPNCGQTLGKKLDKERLETLAHRFFVHGSLIRPKYGGHPGLQFNDRRYPEDSVEFPSWLVADARLIADTLKIGIFLYGPRFWMFGEIEPLKALCKRRTSAPIIQRILAEYPTQDLAPADTFFRLRINPRSPADPGEYDSPPTSKAVPGRLNAPGQSVMYASPDLEVCVHECRTTVDDLTYVATLSPTRGLRLLDVSALLKENVTEFESLDLAVQMLFLAGTHSYRICREIAAAARQRGFDGLVYPSYFTLACKGGMPFPTVYGLSIRRFPSQAEFARTMTVRNLALFGRPIAEGTARVVCINRLVLNRVVYDIQFGPGDFRERDRGPTVA
jgi:hypothetical protein